MTNCCSSNQNGQYSDSDGKCPFCKNKAKKIKLITLKSMLIPSALETINANVNHFFCSNQDCNVVYFDTNHKTYTLSEVKVPVNQKNNSPTVPICYCFEWTKEKIKEHVEKRLSPNPIEHIRENIKENRCGCEINNPQGSCCLGNVTNYIKDLT